MRGGIPGIQKRFRKTYLVVSVVVSVVFSVALPPAGGVVVFVFVCLKPSDGCESLHDISTVTGEEVVLFTLAEAPDCREAKMK